MGWQSHISKGRAGCAPSCVLVGVVVSPNMLGDPAGAPAAPGGTPAVPPAGTADSVSLLL